MIVLQWQKEDKGTAASVVWRNHSRARHLPRAVIRNKEDYFMISSRTYYPLIIHIKLEKSYIKPNSHANFTISWNSRKSSSNTLTSFHSSFQKVIVTDCTVFKRIGFIHYEMIVGLLIKVCFAFSCREPLFLSFRYEMVFEQPATIKTQ